MGQIFNWRSLNVGNHGDNWLDVNYDRIKLPKPYESRLFIGDTSLDVTLNKSLFITALNTVQQPAR